MSTSTSSTHTLHVIKTALNRPYEELLDEAVDATEKGFAAAQEDKSALRDGANRLQKTLAAQDWTGPDDPENPRNWPLGQRVYHSSVPGLFGFVVTFGTSTYTPGLSQVMEQFHVSSTVALLGLSLYVVGLAFGPVLAAPISETKGRKVVYLVSLPLGALFTLGAGFSKSFPALAITRFFAGFFCSPVLAVGAGTNVDIWAPIHRGVSTSLFLLAPFLGPALGPAVGGFSTQYRGWRWTQWDILFLMVPMYLYCLGMNETYKKIILQNRAKRLSIPPPAKTGPSGLAQLRFFLTTTLLRPLAMIFTEPIVFFMSLYVSFNFLVLYSFFAAFPIVFERVYQFDTGFSGLTFLGIAFGCCISFVTAVIVDRVWYCKDYKKSHDEGRGGVVAPENRLYTAMMGGFGLPIGLFWFAWTARANVHWINPILASVVFAWGNVSVFTAAVLYLVDVYGPSNGASAIAANGLMRYSFGAASPLFTVQMYDKLGIAWATSLLAFLSLAMLPIPWILFKYGSQIRKKSNYDTIKS